MTGSLDLENNNLYFSLRTEDGESEIDYSMNKVYGGNHYLRRQGENSVSVTVFDDFSIVRVEQEEPLGVDGRST